MYKFPYKMDYIGSYSATLRNPPEVIGALPEGIRINFEVTGGELIGDKLRGIVKPVGGDWFTLRSDGVCVLDVRATLETHDGALIYVHYNGIGDLGADGHANFLAGKMPKILSLRTAPMMHTTHPDYLWVNRLQFVSIGEVDLETAVVRYDVYAMR
ncbi:MAG: hypothetical protein JWR16_1936 [Nevskia sp.]|nr:hypothetical protein [Nevskia sp.]